MALNDIIRKVRSSIDDTVDSIVEDFREGFSGKYAGSQRGQEYSQYRYPDTATQPDQPFILFTRQTPNYDRKKITTRLSGHISLYIPMNIQIADSFSYDTVETGLVGHAYGMAETKTMDEALDSINADTVRGVATSKTGTTAATAGLAAIGSKLGRLGAIAGGGIGVTAVDAALREYQRREGVTLNPRQFMMFRTPNIRQFSMEFNFIPSSEKESREVQNIIRTFREGAYPTLADSAGITYNFPLSWKIEFMKVQGMIAIPQVVITSINVAYNPNSMSFFTKDNVPMEIRLSLGFSELQPINSKDVMEKGL